MNIDRDTLEWIVAAGERWAGIFIFLLWYQAQQRNLKAEKMEKRSMPFLAKMFKQLLNKLDRIIKILERKNHNDRNTQNNNEKN